jgi:hypothetical protein
MPSLDNYLVTLGVKGQNVVLAQMDKVQKKGKQISKSKSVIDLAGKVAKGGKSAPEKAVEKESAENEKIKRSQKQNNEEEKKTTSKFREAVGRFGQGAQTIASSASSIDPTSAITGMTSALGTSLSGISVLGISLGRLPEGLASISNSMLTMAKNSVDMAKQATAAYHGLATRNAAAEHYGGKVSSGGVLSRNERAMFIDAVSGSMGKIQKPLADQINKLVGTKDTRSLARAAAGDWESTGTDKGWMLGQISGSFQGLPPSVKQKLQASLLKNFSGEIQGMGEDQANAQRNAADWANMDEKQTEDLYRTSITKGGRTNEDIKGIASKLNTMQVGMYGAGLSFAKTVNEVADAIGTLPKRIKDFRDSLDKMINDPSIKSTRNLAKTIPVGK